VIPDLDTVTAISSKDVWAATSSGVQQGVFEHWDGSTWSVVTSPVNTSTNIVNIQSVAAASTGDVWAVGHTRGFGRRAPTLPVIEHWTGTAWSNVTPPTGAYTELFTVAALGVNDAWAVGYNFNPQGPLVQHWDGTSWTVISVPAASGSQILQLSSAAPGTLMGVGNFAAVLSKNA
jgi:hypothetical protein